MAKDIEQNKVKPAEVESELQNALLRMAEHRVLAEMEIDKLNKQLAGKDNIINDLQSQLHQALDRIQQLTGVAGGMGMISSVGGVAGGQQRSPRRASNERKEAVFSDSINNRATMAIANQA